jgi:hypothetical protein
MTGLKTERVIRRLDRRLSGDVPFSRRRAIRREVRANLRAAGNDVGETEAIRRLGDIDEVAADYRTAAGLGRRPFRPDKGVRAVLWTWLGLLLVAVIRIPTFGMVDMFDAHTGAQEWDWGIRYLFEFRGDIPTSTLFEGDVYWTAFIAFGTAAFLVGSRAWRLLPAFRPRPDTEAGPGAPRP